MILQHAVSRIVVRSFTIKKKKYTIHVDDGKNMMQSCSCPDYRKSSGICKHMFLLHRVENLDFPQTHAAATTPPRTPSTPQTTPNREHELNGAIARCVNIPMIECSHYWTLDRYHAALQALSNHASRVSAQNYQPDTARDINDAAQQLESVYSLLKEKDDAICSLGGHQRRI